MLLTSGVYVLVGSVRFSDVVVMKIELIEELELVVEMSHVKVRLPLHGGLIQK
jgi:hypothetical protein